MSKSHLPSIDLLVRWGDAVLETVELSPPRPYFIGDASVCAEGVDFTVPEASLAAPRVPLLDIVDGEVVVRIPPGARALRRSGTSTFGAPPIEADTIPLGAETIDVHVGALVFSVRRSEREERCPRQSPVADRRVVGFFSLTALGTAALVGSLAYFQPPLGLADDEANERDRRFLMMQFLDASAERETKPETGSSEAAPAAADAPKEPARGTSGAMGKPEAAARQKRASGAAPGSDVRPATTREEDLQLAADFGMIGLLSSGAKTGAIAFFTDPGSGPAVAIGAMFGDTTGDSAGIRGLGLLGLDQGGGGFSDQIGLLSVGTCAGSVCGNGPGGFGKSIGRTGREHVARAPTVHIQPPTTSGSLPAEVIQRVVRQSFGRFRGCYEDGLRGNPNLEGRVTTRFVIARDGSVATVHAGGSDLPDARVVACVQRTYSGLTFPPPKDGIVTVSYPLVFSPAA